MIHSNWGMISSNLGMITSNVGIAPSNLGMISSNLGMITSNWGMIFINLGTISSNQGTMPSLADSRSGCSSCPWPFWPPGHMPAPCGQKGQGSSNWQPASSPGSASPRYLLQHKLLLRLHQLLRPLGLLHAAPWPWRLHACPHRVAALSPSLRERPLGLHVLRGGDLPQTGLLAGFSHALRPEGSQMSRGRWQETGRAERVMGVVGHLGEGAQGMREPRKLSRLLLQVW